MPDNRPHGRPTVCELIIIEMAYQHGIDIGDRIDVVRDAIIHIQDEMNHEDEDEDEAQLLMRDRRRVPVTERLLAHIRQQWQQGRGGRISKKRPTARRRRSSKARKARKARTTRRR